MLIEPSNEEIHRAKATRAPAPPATVTIVTEYPERILKPEADEDAFETAARHAVTEAFEAGYEHIAHVDVAEFITLNDSGALTYRYVWEYTAHQA